MDRVDGPELAVADRLAGGRRQGSVVAASDDGLADVGLFAPTDRDLRRAVELAGVDTRTLHNVVDGVDVIVGRGGDRRGAVARRGREPLAGDVVEVVVERVYESQLHAHEASTRGAPQTSGTSARRPS